MCFPATIYPRRLLLSAIARNGSLRHRASPRSTPLRTALSYASVTPVYKKNTFNRWLEICLNIGGYTVKNNDDIAAWRLFIAGAEMKFLEGGRKWGEAFFLKSHATYATHSRVVVNNTAAVSRKLVVTCEGKNCKIQNTNCKNLKLIKIVKFELVARDSRLSSREIVDAREEFNLYEMIFICVYL